jgi:hypothetical protein
MGVIDLLPFGEISDFVTYQHVHHNQSPFLACLTLQPNESTPFKVLHCSFVFVRCSFRFERS